MDHNSLLHLGPREGNRSHFRSFKETKFNTKLWSHRLRKGGEVKWELGSNRELEATATRGRREVGGSSFTSTQKQGVCDRAWGGGSPQERTSSNKENKKKQGCQHHPSKFSQRLLSEKTVKSCLMLTQKVQSEESNPAPALPSSLLRSRERVWNECGSKELNDSHSPQEDMSCEGWK